MYDNTLYVRNSAQERSLGSLRAVGQRQATSTHAVSAEQAELIPAASKLTWSMPGTDRDYELTSARAASATGTDAASGAIAARPVIYTLVSTEDRIVVPSLVNNGSAFEGVGSFHWKGKAEFLASQYRAAAVVVGGPFTKTTEDYWVGYTLHGHAWSSSDKVKPEFFFGAFRPTATRDAIALSRTSKSGDARRKVISSFSVAPASRGTPSASSHRNYRSVVSVVNILSPSPVYAKLDVRVFIRLEPDSESVVGHNARAFGVMFTGQTGLSTRTRVEVGYVLSARQLAAARALAMYAEG